MPGWLEVCTTDFHLCAMRLDLGRNIDCHGNETKKSSRFSSLAHFPQINMLYGHQSTFGSPAIELIALHTLVLASWRTREMKIERRKDEMGAHVPQIFKNGSRLK